MLCKHLKTTGEDWHLYVNPCCYALNTYCARAQSISQLVDARLLSAPTMQSQEMTNHK